MGFVIVDKPAGLATLAALPADVQPQQAGSITYLRVRREVLHAVSDIAGTEKYIVVDTPRRPAGAAPAGPTTSRRPDRPAGTALSVRLASDVSSENKAGDRFQGQSRRGSARGRTARASPPSGTKVHGKVAAAKAGTGMGGAPSLALELTDVEVAGRVVPVVTAQASATGEAKKPGKKILGGAAPGAGISRHRRW